jgi:hypothetical protein
MEHATAAQRIGNTRSCTPPAAAGCLDLLSLPCEQSPKVSSPTYLSSQHQLSPRALAAWLQASYLQLQLHAKQIACKADVAVLVYVKTLL